MTELERLRELEKLVKAMFKRADRKGLYVGMGRNPNHPRPQESEAVKRMREIVLPGTKAE